MSHDMLVAYLYLTQGLEPKWEAAEEKIKELLKTHLVKWPPQYILNECYEWAPGDGKLETDPDMNDRMAQIEILKDDLNAVMDCWDSGTRDSAIIEIGSHLVLLTGGISGGDAPTEAYRHFTRFISSGLAEACGFSY